MFTKKAVQNLNNNTFPLKRLVTKVRYIPYV